VTDDTIKVLLIEDSQDQTQLIRRLIGEIPPPRFQLDDVCNMSDALARLSTRQYDVVMLDLPLSGNVGLDAFRTARSQAPQVPIVVVSDSDDDEVALTAVKEGAQD